MPIKFKNPFRFPSPVEQTLLLKARHVHAIHEAELNLIKARENLAYHKRALEALDEYHRRQTALAPDRPDGRPGDSHSGNSSTSPGAVHLFPPGFVPLS